MYARAEALARRSKPFSHILPPRSRLYAVADDPMFASSLPASPSFAQLVGTRAVGSKRRGSISFSEMERVPESAGDDFIVTLADVRNSRCAEV